jgi:hypothetical protein
MKDARDRARRLIEAVRRRTVHKTASRCKQSCTHTSPGRAVESEVGGKFRKGVGLSEDVVQPSSESPRTHGISEAAQAAGTL